MNIKNNFFSIVIPVYNSSSTIIDCLQSCVKQTYSNFEIIIIDDCSVDNTNMLIDRFILNNLEFKITLVKQKINKGASSARNKGISMSNGELITLLDSDDYFHPQKLEIISDIFNKNKSIDMLGHSFTINNLHPDIDVEQKIKKIKCYRLMLKNFAVTPSITFRKAISIRFNETMRYTEDHDFFLRVCYNGLNIYYVNIPLVSLNRELLSTGGQSSSNIKMRLGEMKMYFNLYKINLMFIFITPFLVIFSILKYIIRKVISI